MTVTPRKRPHALPVAGGAIAIILVALVATRLTANSGEARPIAASQNTIGTASAASTTRPKERIRYQAIIENWRRYRAATASN